jgi:hypothetical protein
MCRPLAAAASIQSVDDIYTYTAMNTPVPFGWLCVLCSGSVMVEVEVEVEVQPVSID